MLLLNERKLNFFVLFCYNREIYIQKEMPEKNKIIKNFYNNH